jgi:hypothetical protein|tara:strand:+ start:2635 stop:3093 length:459 start_codon:yes stop_codon:yes gene_type:complete
MPGRKIKITDDLREVLRRSGYTPVTMQVSGVKKVTLYKEVDGKWLPMPNMPGDPHSLQKYLSRGFLLAPPGSNTTEHPDYVVSDPHATREIDTAQPKKSPVAAEDQGEFHCDVCVDDDRVFTSVLGLKTHRRKSKVHKSIVKAATEGLVAVT